MIQGPAQFLSAPSTIQTKTCAARRAQVSKGWDASLTDGQAPHGKRWSIALGPQRRFGLHAGHIDRQRHVLVGDEPLAGDSAPARRDAHPIVRALIGRAGARDVAEAVAEADI